MVGRVGRRWVLIGDMRHTWVFQREDEIDGRLDCVDEGGSLGVR